MKILSIETSCDETAISILKTKNNLRYSGDVSFRVLANNIASQVKIHAPYGGVYPMLAKREHIKNLPILLAKTLKDAGIFRERSLAQAGEPSRAKIQQNFMRAESAKNLGIDLIAVTSGPGLEPALWTGIVFAKELAKKWNCPLIPVNHMEGHILSVFGKEKGKFTVRKTRFPALSLLISGGHTELVLVTEKMSARGGSAFGGKYKVIGETLDDAAGEAFDKVARMLGLPYPGGPEISKLAASIRRDVLFRGTDIFLLKNSSYSSRRSHKPPQGHISASQSSGFILPRPMIYSKNFDFSFSGLKTAVLYLIKKIGPLDEKTKAKIAMEFENAVIETLIYKTQKAIERYKIKTLIVAGGVSANNYLKREIKRKISKKTQVLFPDKKLATDNSIMIGIVGYLQYIKNKGKVKRVNSIKADGNLRLSN